MFRFSGLQIPFLAFPALQLEVFLGSQKYPGEDEFSDKRLG